jgi:hypothetical protein
MINMQSQGKQESTYNFMLSPYGVEYGVTIGQQERTDDINKRIIDRMFPDVDLRPNFDPRPVSTKYSLFPIVDSYARTTENYKPYLDYYPEVMFNPGNAKAPVSGIINKIDMETELRNQTSLANKYIPPLDSDMYKVEVKSKDDNAAIKAHPLLFAPFLVSSSTNNEIHSSIGADRFHNHTRTQLRSTA